MKSTVLRVLASMLLACGLTSCPETTVGDDFGLKPVELEADDWSGDWIPVDDDDIIQFAITDARQGGILMTEPGKKDADPVEFKLRRASADDKVGLFFAVVRERKEKKGGASLFLMREPEKGVWFTWAINHGRRGRHQVRSAQRHREPRQGWSAQPSRFGPRQLCQAAGTAVLELVRADVSEAREEMSVPDCM